MNYVYILASKEDGVLYIGATNNLKRRIYEHRSALVNGFSRRYFVWRLVYYEIAGTMDSAFYRERQLKKWNRAWKLRLIKEFNPGWEDLYKTI